MLDIAPREITIPMLLFGLSSTINSLLASVGIEVKFILWIFGQTGTRKTTISKLFFNFISMNSLTVNSSFKDTISSLQYKMSIMKDSVIFIDDYHPPTTNNEQNELDEKVGFITRSTSDTSSKGRMNRNMTQQSELKNEGNVAVTAEDIIKGHSALSRTYPILLKPESINLNRLGKVQKNIDIYSTFISNFIEWISIDTLDKVHAIKKYFEVLRGELSGIKVHGRVIEQVVQLYMICELYLFYGLENKYISISEAKEIRNETKEILISHIHNMNSLLSCEKPSYLYLKAIEEMVLSNHCKLVPKGKNNGSSNVIGWEDDEKIYLIPGVAYSYVIKYYKNLNIEFSKSIKSIHQELNDHGLIKTGKDSNTLDYTVKSNVFGDSSNRKRTLTILKDKYQKFMESESKETNLNEDLVYKIPPIDKYMSSKTLGNNSNIYNKILVDMAPDKRSEFDELFNDLRVKKRLKMETSKEGDFVD